MKTQVHPLVAVIVIAAALVAVWFVYTRVFTGQQQGIIGPPSGVSLPPPPAKETDMPKRTQSPKPAEKPSGEKAAGHPESPHSRR